MTRAWEIARKGAKEFGGKVVEYFAEALKLAWKEIKNMKAIVTTTSGSRNHKSWVAEITGKDARFGFARKFVNPVEENGDKTFELENGFYEVSNGGERKFVNVDNGQVNTVSKSDVMAAL